MPTVIDGTTGVNQVQPGVIVEDDLANNAVTTTKINNGAVTIAKLSATGTADSTTYLRGDGSWQTISTSPTTAQVLTATAGASVGAVGTYAFLGSTSFTATAAGSTKAGSSLRYAGARATSSFSNDLPTGNVPVGNGGTPSGTWRAMGRDFSNSSGDGDFYGVTLWLRIS